MNNSTEIHTKEPVTTSGWYELTDGRVQYFSWDSGRLEAGTILLDWEDVQSFKSLSDAWAN